MSLDLDTIREQRKQKVATVMKYFGIIMAIFYFVMGGVFAFTNLFADVPLTVRYIFGTALFLYGIFRAYRIFRGE